MQAAAKLKPLSRSDSAEDRTKPKAVALDGMSLYREFNSVYVRAPGSDDSHFVSAEGTHLFYQRSLGVWMVSALHPIRTLESNPLRRIPVFYLVCFLPAS